MTATGRFLMGGCAAALALVLGAAPAPAQSLADTLVQAYRNSPELAAQRGNIKVSSELAVQARSQGRLQADANFSISANTETGQRSVFRTVNGQRVASGAGREGGFLNFDEVDYPLAMSLDFTQPIYTGGQVENATEAAEKRIGAQEALLIATEQQVLLDAVTAHMDVIRDASFVDLGINNVRVLTEQLRAASERFEVGEVTRTDVEQARARLAAARSALAAARGALSVSKEAYLRVVGSPPGKVAAPPPLPELPENLADAVAIALIDDPNVQAARIERDAASSDVRAAIGALLPQVALQGAVSRSDRLLRRHDGFDQARVGITLTIPLYAGGFNYSNVREAQANAEVSTANITQAERNAIQNVGIAWAQLEVARATIRAGILEVQAAQLAFDGVREEAKVGARTTLDVLDAEQELLDARANVVASRRDEQVAAYTLLATMGKLTVGHLGLDVAPDTGDAYYETVRSRNFGYDATDDTVWSLSYRP